MDVNVILLFDLSLEVRPINCQWVTNEALSCVAGEMTLSLRQATNVWNLFQGRSYRDVSNLPPPFVDYDENPASITEQSEFFKHLIILMYFPYPYPSCFNH